MTILIMLIIMEIIYSSKKHIHWWRIFIWITTKKIKKNKNINNKSNNRYKEKIKNNYVIIDEKQRIIKINSGIYGNEKKKKQKEKANE